MHAPLQPSDPVRVSPCESPRRFVEAQRAFYRDDPHFVPPLTAFDRHKVDPDRHPFFEHAEAGFWLAHRGARLVGRISAFRDAVHDAFHGDRVGFFGHFEATDAPAARAILDTAADWLAARGATTLRGPIDGSTNYRCGLLLEGDEGPPFVMMPHNPHSYAGYLEATGLRKAKDLVALLLRGEDLQLDRLERIASRVQVRTPLSARTLDLRRFDAEVHTLWGLYNRIWERNWGFVPMSEAEFRAEARDLRAVLRKELTVVLERAGEPVAFALGVPDVHEAIRACGGRLLPFGWLRAWRTLRRTTSFRTLTLGILPELRGTGTDAVLLLQLIRQGLAAGFPVCEASWILEDNLPMLRPLQGAGGRVYRRYRIYERPLPGVEPNG